jgi:hypothetical protein
VLVATDYLLNGPKQFLWRTWFTAEVVYTQACLTYTRWHGRYMISSLKARHDWCVGASLVQVHFWALRYFSWYGSFTKKQGGICWHPKLARLRFSGQSGQIGQTSKINWSDQSRQVCQIANWTTPLRRSRQDDWNAYIERPIWSPDEEVMPPGTPAPVRPVRNAQFELGVVFWHEIW